jgi:hypothetical protein
VVCLTATVPATVSHPARPIGKAQCLRGVFVSQLTLRAPPIGRLCGCAQAATLATPGDEVPRCLRWCCNLCGAEFSSVKHRDTHILTHADLEKYFQCDGCQRQFVFERALTTHMNTVCHGNSSSVSVLATYGLSTEYEAGLLAHYS